MSARISKTKKRWAAAALCGVWALPHSGSAQTDGRAAVLGRGGARYSDTGEKVPSAPAPSASSSSASSPSAAYPAVTSRTAASATPMFSARPQASGAAAAGTATATVASAGPTPRSLPPASISGNSTMDGDFNVPLPDEKTLRIQVGHTLFIDTRHRLQRMYVTNPDVLSSYTASPNEVVLTAKAPGTSEFIIWDEVGDTQVYMVSAETNVDNLNTAIKKAFPNEDIQANSMSGRITLSGAVGTQAMSDAIAKFAEGYGKDVANQIAVNPSRIKQVRLKVRFAEVDRSRITQFGFNLFAILNGNGSNATLLTSTTGAFPSTFTTGTSSGSSSSTVGSQSVSVSNALNFTIYNAAHNLGATIQDLEDKQVMHILAEPNITAMSGEKANFLAGGEFPFPVVQGGTAGSAAAVSIIFKPYGVKLEFTPLVNADGSIDLTVAPEVSALDYSNAVSIGGYTIPAISTRRAATRVTLRDGQSFAITGLLDQRTTDALGRTPGIASIPILGALFRSKNINHSNSELLVIVTPELVDPLVDRETPPAAPQSPVPTLNQQKFDNSLPDSIKKPGAAK